MARPRKPTAALKLQGTFRPDRRPAQEPQPDVRVPDCPDWLDANARAEWERVTPLLAELGLLAEIDATMLSLYCHYYSEFLAAKAMVDKGGLLLSFDRRDGKILVRNPACATMHAAADQCRRIAAEFGFTPAARTKIETERPPAAGSLKAFNTKTA